MIGLTFNPLTLCSKREGLGKVVVEHEWWVSLFGIQIIIDKDHGSIIVFVIGKSWKLIGLSLIDVDDVDCLKICDEVGETVSEYLSVKVQLNQLVKSRATSKDGPVFTDIIFILSENIKGSSLLISIELSKIWFS
jgi:uncharacterized Fe-S cluster-containing protein